MGSRGVLGLVAILMMAGTTAGVAATGGLDLHSAGNATAAQYGAGTPAGPTENSGTETCRDLARRNRGAERVLRARNTRYARRYAGRNRARILRYLRAQEASLHRSHVSAERQCRRNGGR
jgi:hypothetical protein